MTNLVLAYITCESEEQAKQIGLHLLEKRMAACMNIIPGMTSMYFWPAKSGKIATSNETILIAKTTEEKFKVLEAEVEKTHTYTVPCIMAIPLKHVSKKYADWLLGELENKKSNR